MAPTRVQSQDILDGTVTTTDLAFDPATQAELDAHVTDTSAAHAATAISFSPASTLTSTDVQAAIEEVISDIGSGVVGVAADGWVNDTADTWTYASADAPTFTFTISGDRTSTLTPGKRIKLTQSSAVKYFIVTASAFASSTTTVTIYGGTDYTLANSAITANYHSGLKGPDGFPLDPNKWTVITTDTAQRSQSSPVNNTWYNMNSNSIVVPIGCWVISLQVVLEIDQTASDTAIIAFATLSTANNTESDKDYTGMAFTADASAAGKGAAATIYREKTETLAAKSTRYVNLMSSSGGSGLFEQNAAGTLIVRAVCAYL